MNKLLVVDGNNILLRALFARTDVELTSRDGTPTGVLYRCMNSIFRHIKMFQPTHFMCIFDHGRSEYRIALRPEYKANRDDDDNDPDREERKERFLEELARWQGAMDDLFLCHLSQPKVEADDIIASAVEHYPGRKLVISSDHDLLQLVSPSVQVHAPAQNRNMESVTYNEGKVREKYGCSPDDLVKMWALAGDKGDNVIGLHRVGNKTALKKLVEHNFDFEAVVSALAKTDKDADRVRENIDLVALHPELFTDLPDFDGLEIDYSMLRSDIEDWAKKWDFTSFVRRLDNLV